MRAASTAGEGDGERVSHSKRINSSQENAEAAHTAPRARIGRPSAHRKRAPRYTRYEVVGFGVANGGLQLMRIGRIGPDNYWFGARPRTLEPDRSCDRLAGLQRDVLIGSGIGEARDQPEAGFTDSRPVTIDEGELPDRRIHRALVQSRGFVLQKSSKVCCGLRWTPIARQPEPSSKV